MGNMLLTNLHTETKLLTNGGRGNALTPCACMLTRSSSSMPHDVAKVLPKDV